MNAPGFHGKAGSAATIQEAKSAIRGLASSRTLGRFFKATLTASKKAPRIRGPGFLE